MATANSITRPPTIGLMPGKGQSPGKPVKQPLPTVPTKGGPVSKGGAPNNLAEIARKRLAKLG